MPFFKSTPNLPDDEKARIEFHLQQIAECIGFQRFKLPVLPEDEVRSRNGVRRSVDEIVKLVGGHLGYDVSSITIQTVPLPRETSGGGG